MNAVVKFMPPLDVVNWVRNIDEHANANVNKVRFHFY
jgi:hypothetical protein